MKIRSGFVSNSSSSSFIVIGCELPKKLQEKLGQSIGITDANDSDWMYRDELESKYGLRILCTEDSKDGNYVFGKILADISYDGEYLDRSSVSFKEMKDVEIKIHELLGENVDVSLIMGTRPS